MEQPDFDEIADAIMSPIEIADASGDKKAAWKAAIEATVENVWEMGVAAGGREVLRLIDEYTKAERREAAEKADLETINNPEGN